MAVTRMLQVRLKHPLRDGLYVMAQLESFA